MPHLLNHNPSITNNPSRVIEVGEGGVGVEEEVEVGSALIQLFVNFVMNNTYPGTVQPIEQYSREERGW